MSRGGNLNLEYLRKAAKRLVRAFKEAHAEALTEVARHHPKHTGKLPAQMVDVDFSLHDAQLVVARQRGFASWPAMIAFIGHDDSTDARSSELTDDQLRCFEDQGYIRLSGAFERGDALEMERFIWDSLAKCRGILEKDTSTWSVPGPWVGLNKFKREAVFAPIYQGRFRGVCDQLLGQNEWAKPTSSGGFLVTFPDCKPEQWSIPTKAWHVDAHFTFDPNQLFGLRVFSYVSDVPSRGGGTLVVRGSHRLVKRFVASMPEDERRKGYGVLQDEFKATHPWLRELCDESHKTESRRSRTDRIDYFMDHPCWLDDVSVQVEELSGAPGDMIIAHPWILHSAAPHAGPRPRFMLSKDVFRLGAIENERPQHATT